jgi:hypothetical protein
MPSDPQIDPHRDFANEYELAHLDDFLPGSKRHTYRDLREARAKHIRAHYEIMLRETTEPSE